MLDVVVVVVADEVRVLVTVVCTMDVRVPTAVLVTVKSVVREVELVIVVRTVEVTVEGIWASTLRSDETNRTAAIEKSRTETTHEANLDPMPIRPFTSTSRRRC